MTEYIVHADDFGYSASVNDCINYCFLKGWLSETSLMVNMSGCEEAVALARKHGYAQYVGLHLNLTEGVPLTEKIKTCHRFCSKEGVFNKVFHTSLSGRFLLTRTEISAVKEEIIAQINRFISYDGLMMKLDSHHHAHTDWAVYNILKPIAIKYGFMTMRITADLHKVSIWKSLYKYILNTNIRHHFNTTDHFDGIVDELLTGPVGTTEVMVHPLMWNGVLCDSHKSFLDNIMKVVSVKESHIRAIK